MDKVHAAPAVGFLLGPTPGEGDAVLPGAIDAFAAELASARLPGQIRRDAPASAEGAGKGFVKPSAKAVAGVEGAEASIIPAFWAAPLIARTLTAPSPAAGFGAPKGDIASLTAPMQPAAITPQSPPLQSLPVGSGVFGATPNVLPAANANSDALANTNAPTSANVSTLMAGAGQIDVPPPPAAKSPAVETALLDPAAAGLAADVGGLGKLAPLKTPLAAAQTAVAVNPQSMPGALAANGAGDAAGPIQIAQHNAQERAAAGLIEALPPTPEAAAAGLPAAAVAPVVAARSQTTPAVLSTATFAPAATADAKILGNGAKAGSPTSSSAAAPPAVSEPTASLDNAATKAAAPTPDFLGAADVATPRATTQSAAQIVGAAAAQSGVKPNNGNTNKVMRAGSAQGAEGGVSTTTATPGAPALTPAKAAGDTPLLHDLPIATADGGLDSPPASPGAISVGAPSRPTDSAATAAPPQAQAGAPPKPHLQLAQQIVRRFDGQNTHFEMRLDPPELGRVEVRLQMGPDRRVSATIAAEQASTLTELARASRELERILESVGFELDSGGLNFTMTQDQPGSDRGDARAQDAIDSAGLPDTHEDPIAIRAARPFGLEAWRVGRVDVIA
jgi:flagellar hook-length control protein FliK